MLHPSARIVAAAGGDGSVALRTARARDTDAVCLPVGPLEIARAEKIAHFLADSGEIGLGQAAVSCDQAGRETVCALVRQIRRHLLLQDRAHASVGGAIEPWRRMGNRCA